MKPSTLNLIALRIFLCSIFVVFYGCGEKRYAYDVEYIINCNDVSVEDLGLLVEATGNVYSELTTDSTYFFPLYLSIKTDNSEPIYTEMLPEQHDGTGVSVVSESISVEVEQKVIAIKEKQLQKIKIPQIVEKQIEYFLEGKKKSKATMDFARVPMFYDPFSEGGYSIVRGSDTIKVESDLDSLQSKMVNFLSLHPGQEYVDDKTVRNTVRIVVVKRKNGDPGEPRLDPLVGDTVVDGGISGIYVKKMGSTISSQNHPVDLVMLDPLSGQYYLVTNTYRESGTAESNSGLGLRQLISAGFVNARVLRVSAYEFKTILVSSSNLDAIRGERDAYVKKYPDIQIETITGGRVKTVF